MASEKVSFFVSSVSNHGTIIFLTHFSGFASFHTTAKWREDLEAGINPLAAGEDETAAAGDQTEEEEEKEDSDYGSVQADVDEAEEAAADDKGEREAPTEAMPPKSTPGRKKKPPPAAAKATGSSVSKNTPAAPKEDLNELASDVAHLSIGPAPNLHRYQKGKPSTKITPWCDPATRQVHFMVFISVHEFILRKDYTASLQKPNIVKVVFHKTASDAAYLHSEQLIYTSLKDNPHDYDDKVLAQANALSTGFEMLSEASEEELIIEIPMSIDVGKGFFNAASQDARGDGNSLSHFVVRDPYQLNEGMDIEKCDERKFSFISLYVEAADKPKQLAQQAKTRTIRDTTAADEGLRRLRKGRHRGNAHQMIQEMGRDVASDFGISLDSDDQEEETGGATMVTDHFAG